jgi:hypothetical protein
VRLWVELLALATPLRCHSGTLGHVTTEMAAKAVTAGRQHAAVTVACAGGPSLERLSARTRGDGSGGSGRQRLQAAARGRER